MTDLWDENQVCSHNNRYRVNNGWLLVGWDKHDDEVYLTVAPEARMGRRRYFRTRSEKKYGHSIKVHASWLPKTEVEKDLRDSMFHAHKEAFPEQYSNGHIKPNELVTKVAEIRASGLGVSATESSDESLTDEDEDYQPQISNKSATLRSKRSFSTALGQDLQPIGHSSVAYPPEDTLLATQRYKTNHSRTHEALRTTPKAAFNTNYDTIVLNTRPRETRKSAKEVMFEAISSWETGEELPDDHPMCYLRTNF